MCAVNLKNKQETRKNMFSVQIKISLAWKETRTTLITKDLICLFSSYARSITAYSSHTETVDWIKDIIIVILFIGYALYSNNNE